MTNITLKPTAESRQMLKNIATVLFTFFANFFNWFIIVVCLVVLISGYWFLIKPKYDFIISDQEITVKEKEYEDKVNYLKQLGEVKNLYKTITDSDKEKVDYILSSSMDIDALKIALLREVGYLGRLYRVTVDNVVITPLDNSSDKFLVIAEPPKPSSQLQNFQIVTVSFSLGGVDYPRLKQVLAKIERSLRIMDVVSVDYNPDSRTANVVLYAYYLKH